MLHAILLIDQTTQLFHRLLQLGCPRATLCDANAPPYHPSSAVCHTSFATFLFHHPRHVVLMVLLLKKSVWLLLPICGKALSSTIDSRGVALALSRYCCPYTAISGLNWCSPRGRKEFCSIRTIYMVP